jgi:hypothetical protein
MANVSRSVGQDLLDVPFPEMITKMALAIAEGQMALDMNSIDVAQTLANTMLPADSVIVAIKETVDADGKVTNTEVLYNDKEMPLLVYGLNPTFYEFAETIIEVKMSITMKTERSAEREFGKKFSFDSKTDIKTNFSAGGGFLSSLFGTPKVTTEIKNTTTVAYVSTYNAKYSQKYSYQAEGTSLLRTTLRPVPPPARAIPTITVQEPEGDT